VRDATALAGITTWATAIVGLVSELVADALLSTDGILRLMS
jgi:hypothetical protein